MQEEKCRERKIRRGQTNGSRERGLSALAPKSVKAGLQRIFEGAILARAARPFHLYSFARDFHFLSAARRKRLQTSGGQIPVIFILNGLDFNKFSPNPL